MALLEKKTCDICDGQIGLLGNRKLDDGNLCKDCAGKLSRWMTDRRRTTVEDIRKHLAYREENEKNLAQFNPTTAMGDEWQVYIDQAAGNFVVSKSKNWRNENPDIIAISQVLSCDIDRKESRDEIYQVLPDGTKKSYVPAQYKYSYDFEVKMQINSPWFNEMKFPLNAKSFLNPYAPDYQQCEALGMQLRALMTPGAAPMPSTVPAAAQTGFGPPTQPYQQPVDPYQQVQQPYQQPAPVAQPYQQPVQQPYQQPAPVAQPYQPVQQPYQQPVQQPYQQPVDPYGQPYQQPVPVAQPYQQPVAQPYQQPVQQPYQQPVAQPYQQPYQQPVQQPYQQPVQQPYQQPFQPPYQQ